MMVLDMEIARSEQIDKTLFHFPELADSQPHEKGGYGHAEPDAGQIELALPAEQAPAKPVNDANQGIQGINKPPFVRNDARAKADRRPVKAQLHDERNDVAKIPILDVECRDPHADSK